MVNIEDMMILQEQTRPPWIKTVVRLLPLWLIALSITAEGFPKPPISVGVSVAAFACAVLLLVVLWWKKWMRLEFALYSLLPTVMLPLFDEIVTTYKTPFILMCAILISLPVIACHAARNPTERFVILAAGMILNYLIIHHVMMNYWEVIEQTGFSDGYMAGNYPLDIPGFPWWKIFWKP